MNTQADTAPEQPDDDAPVEADSAPAPAAPVEADSAPAPAAPVQPTPALPPPAPPTPILLTQSREDTDVGWGDYRDRDDDDHLLRDRPPHWDNT
jgi:hypothetical protein